MDSYTNRPRVLLGVLWTQSALATLFTAVRFYARHLLDTGIGWDDWTMLIALFFEFAATSILSRAVHFGFGSHQNTLTPENAQKALQFQWIFQPVQVTSTIIARASVAIMVIRLFPTKKAMKTFLILLTVFNAAVGIVGFTLIFTQCSPSQKLWNSRLKGHCISSNIQKDVAIFKASISALSDLATAAWPIAIVWTLHMRLRKRLFLMTLFALTVVAMVCCVVEAVYLTANAVRDDETYVAALSAIWTCTPVNVLIIVGSIPTFPPLVKEFARSRYRHDSGSSNRWPTQKRFTHPSDDSTIGIYPLRDRNTYTNITSRGKEEGLEEHAADEGKTARCPRAGEMERRGIHKTTDFDIEYQPRCYGSK